MKKILILISVLALTLSFGGTVEARPANFCERKPTHPSCQPPTPSPTPTVAPSPTPTNPAIPPEPAGWNRVVLDDFSTNIAEGGFPNTNWGAYPYDWPDTWRRGVYDPKIVSQHDGLLDMSLRQIDGQWRSVSISPRVNNTTLYSTSFRISLRMWATSSTGYHVSFLTWPQASDCFGVFEECWPRDGEVDFPEGRLDGTISAFMHRQGATTGSDQDAFSTSARFTQIHTFTTEWIAGQSCKFFLDGVLIGQVTSRVPSKPMRIQLQVQTSPSGTLSPAHVYLDWVTVATK